MACHRRQHNSCILPQRLLWQFLHDAFCQLHAEAFGRAEWLFIFEHIESHSSYFGGQGSNDLDSQTAVFAQQTLQNLPNHRVSGGILSDFGKSPTQVGVAVFGIAQALAFAVTQFAR